MPTLSPKPELPVQPYLFFGARLGPMIGDGLSAWPVVRRADPAGQGGTTDDLEGSQVTQPLRASP